MTVLNRDLAEAVRHRPRDGAQARSVRVAAALRRLVDGSVGLGPPESALRRNGARRWLRRASARGLIRTRATRQETR